MSVRDRVRETAQQSREGGGVAAKPRTIIDVLASAATREQIQMALPPALDVDRFLRMARTAVKLDPYLQSCTADSFVAALHKAAMYGLEVGTGQAYLQRYGDKCQFILGYRGIIELARRSGRLRSIEARSVRENDVFEFEYGLDETLRHRPALEDAGELRCFYGIARFTDGGHYWLVVSMGEILRHRDRSEAWVAYNQKQKGNGGAWNSDFEAMARKTVIRICEPYLPLTPEVREAIQADGTFQDDVESAAQYVDTTAEADRPPASIESDPDLLTTDERGGEPNYEQPPEDDHGA